MVYFRGIRGEYRNSIYHELVPGEWQASVIKFSGGAVNLERSAGVSFQELLNQAYEEYEMYERYKKQKEMAVEDIAGPKGICYEAVKVSGTKASDLADIVERIESNTAGIAEIINKTLDELQCHRRKAYECLKLAPNTVGKLAVEEHYLKKKPWEEIALEQNYSREHIKKLAYECIRRVEEVMDKDDAK